MTGKSRDEMLQALEHALTALDGRDPARAIALLLDAIELPKSRHVMRRICREFPEAVDGQTLSRLEQAHPDDPYLVSLAGQKRLDAGDFLGAGDLFGKATKLDPPRQAAFAGLCEVALKLENWSLLQQTSELFSDHFPGSAWAWHFSTLAADHRSQFLVHTASDRSPSALVLNYKCGFSTLNEATEGAVGWHRDLRVPAEFTHWYKKESRTRRPQVFSVSRHPMSRIVSYYWNWFLRLKPDFVHPDGETNKPFGLVRDVMAPRRFAAFLEAGREGRRTPEMFETFVQTVPLIFDRDPHLHPQHRVFSELELPIQSVRFFDLSRIGELLDELGLERETHVNNSKITNYDELVTPGATDIINRLYAADFARLGYPKGSAV